MYVLLNSKVIDCGFVVFSFDFNCWADCFNDSSDFYVFFHCFETHEWFWFEFFKLNANLVVHQANYIHWQNRLVSWDSVRCCWVNHHDFVRFWVTSNYQNFRLVLEFLLFNFSLFLEFSLFFEFALLFEFLKPLGFFEFGLFLDFFFLFEFHLLFCAFSLNLFFFLLGFLFLFIFKVVLFNFHNNFWLLCIKDITKIFMNWLVIKRNLNFANLNLRLNFNIRNLNWLRFRFLWFYYFNFWLFNLNYFRFFWLNLNFFFDFLRYDFDFLWLHN